MRGQSHRRLGQYLAEHYMAHVPGICVKAFQLGCIEPDRNPLTYLKGSLRCQWLRGHNYHNAQRYMRRICRYLEKKDHLNLYDYYSLGKLIHYTADAFTYAHNADFPSRLSSHMEYEAALQNRFLEFMSEDPQVNPIAARSIMCAISDYHRHYEQLEYTIHNDCRFALTACCCVLAILFAPPMI